MSVFKIEHLAEPKLQFGAYFEHEDSKTGLAEFGPFGLNVDGLHPSEIRIGIIGTSETISGVKEWIERCAAPIASSNQKAVSSSSAAGTVFKKARFGAGILDEEAGSPDSVMRIDKRIDRDFVGFSKESPFRCEFQLNPRWERQLHSLEVRRILEIADEEERILSLARMFDEEIRSLSQTGPKPDVIILALTSDMTDEAYSVRVREHFHLNFRRLIKALAMNWGIPVQLIRRSTILGKKSASQREQVQDPATRAWNFCAALYYKANGVPWRPTAFDEDTCFVGISFYVAKEGEGTLTMQSSVSQVFDYLGQGLVLRGEPFQWDSKQDGRTPHMTREAASSLISGALKEYLSLKKRTPKRVVIHKPSRFWGKDHGDFNERDGFVEGVQSVLDRIKVDLVTLAESKIRLFREAQYPPLRGTYFQIGDAHCLYTMGYIPYLETYPSSYIPVPWQILERHGATSEKDLFREVLQLTKMNVNNCSFADGVPITMSFSKKVGEILKHIPDEFDSKVQSDYRFYM